MIRCYLIIYRIYYLFTCSLQNWIYALKFDAASTKTVTNSTSLESLRKLWLDGKSTLYPKNKFGYLSQILLILSGHINNNLFLIAVRSKDMRAREGQLNNSRKLCWIAFAHYCINLLYNILNTGFGEVIPI